MFHHVRRSVLPLLLIALLVSVGLPLQPASASAANFLQLTGVDYSSCTPGDWVSVSLFVKASAGTTTHRWSLSNPRTGTATLNEFPYGVPTGMAGVYSLAVPAGTVAGDALVMRVVVDPVGAATGSFSELIFNCSTGAVISNVFNRDGTEAVFAGAPIPAGFVLRAITCDTALFDAPGGQAVASAQVKAGQSWYVNPTPVADPSGASWTEIFVSGRVNPFIPTACVGG